MEEDPGELPGVFERSLPELDSTRRPFFSTDFFTLDPESNQSDPDPQILVDA